MRILSLLIISSMILSSCTIYRELSEEDKAPYRLDSIDLNNHNEQSDSVLYSIDS